jgi:CubicO group peptidase (beta-lactamase class C family)
MASVKRVKSLGRRIYMNLFKISEMKATQKNILAFLSIFLFLNCNCEKDFNENWQANAPASIDDGLETGTLEELNIDAKRIAGAVCRIHKGKYGEIHSMLIYKDKKIVFEEYFKGPTYQWDAPGHYGDYVSWNREMQHCIHSDTKSITSLCVGIAIDKGYIKSVHQSIFDYLPGYEHYKKDGKEKITIEHLLTMTSGLQWEEWKISLGSVENDQIAIWFYEDGPVNYVLRKPLVAEPGIRFNYSGGDIQLLAEILENASGMALDDFSGQYIFQPLGIDTYDWWLIFPSGEIQAAGGLKLTPRDMVKIGAMMLNKGLWNGNQIISEDWIEKCASPYPGNSRIKVPGEDLGKVGYSYTWWTKNFSFKGQKIDLYFALGWGGQKIVIIPDLDVVLVFTGANYNSKVHEFEILERFVIPLINMK